jgi:hypothetical protein
LTINPQDLSSSRPRAMRTPISASAA